MRLSEIKPFVRYVHFINIDKEENYGHSVPFDNRLFYLWQGASAITVEGKRYELSEGDGVIIPSGVGYELLPSDEKVTYVGVNFDYTESNADKSTPVPPMFSGEFVPDMRFESLSFSDAEELNAPLVVRGVGTFAGRLLAMEKEYGEKRFGFECVMSGMLSEMIVECVRAHRSMSFGKNQGAVKVVIEYIDKNFATALSNSMIAKACGLHPNYVSHLVRHYTGIPLHQYLLRVRISHSMDLLSQRTYSIGEIAERCGFVDIYHFSKAFKNITGFSPSKYM